MTREERKLRKHFEEHAGGRERQKMLKEAAKLRHAERSKRPRERVDPRKMDWDDWNDELPAAKKRKASKAGTPGVEGIVLGIGPGCCKVLCGDREIDSRPLPGLAVGDRVMVTNYGRRVEAIRQMLPRSTALSRPDPHNPHLERVIAANIDLVVIVVSIQTPPLHTGLIDRYLIAIEESGAEPVVCVNKMDLGVRGQELAALEPYRELGLRIVTCSAVTGEGLEELLDAMSGKLCVLVGHSGVGKSSLLNAVCPELRLETKTVSEAHGKGRHTTSSSRLYAMPNGARIIDTPGIREFGLWEVRGEELRRYFHEFDSFAPGCSFGDCAHVHEPGCAVREAVEGGMIAASRYEAYRRILGSLAEPG